MKIQKEEQFQSVMPDEGMMLTNGEVISDGMYTPIGADLTQWREITKEEAEQLQAEIDERLNAQVEETLDNNEEEWMSNQTDTQSSGLAL